jgi:hypothetical protein
MEHVISLLCFCSDKLALLMYKNDYVFRFLKLSLHLDLDKIPALFSLIYERDIYVFVGDRCFFAPDKHEIHTSLGCIVV